MDKKSNGSYVYEFNLRCIKAGERGKFAADMQAFSASNEEDEDKVNAINERILRWVVRACVNPKPGLDWSSATALNASMDLVDFVEVVQQFGAAFRPILGTTA